MDLRMKLVRTALTMTDHARLKKQPFDYPDVRLIKAGNERSRLDLYLPRKDSHPLPLIVDIHGGGLVYGGTILNRWTASEMATRGYAVAVISYPLMPGATVHEQIQSILDSLSQLEQTKLPLDFDRVYLKGDSAGGLLALLTTIILADGSRAESFQVNHHFSIKGLALVHPMVDTRRKDLLSYIFGNLGDLPSQARSKVRPSTKNSFKRKILPNRASQPNSASQPNYNGQATTLFRSRKISRIKVDPTASRLLELLHKPLSGTAVLPPVWLVTSQNDVMFHAEAIRLAKKLTHEHTPHELHTFSWSLRRPLNHIFMITHPHLEESQHLYDGLARFFSLVSPENL